MLPVWTNNPKKIFRSDLTIQTFVKLDCNLISNHMAVVWIQFVNNAFHVCLFFSSIQTTNIWTDLSLIQNLISVACLNKWWSMFQWFILLSQFFYNVMHLTMFRSIYNLMQSSPFNESYLSLFSVAFSASSFCFTSFDGKLTQGPVPSFKGPQLDSVDAKVIAFKVRWL